MSEIIDCRVDVFSERDPDVALTSIYFRAPYDRDAVNVGHELLEAARRLVADFSGPADRYGDVYVNDDATGKQIYYDTVDPADGGVSR
jgi:hypothetical protein